MANASGRTPSKPLSRKPAASTRNALARRALLTELGDRAAAKPGSPVQIRAIVNQLRPAIALHQEQDGRLVHGYGTNIAWFFGVRADEVLGRANFPEFLAKDLGLPLSVAYQYVRAAKVATAEQAAWGLPVVLDLASILDLLAPDPALRRAYKVSGEPRTISDLAGVVFKLSDKREFTVGQEKPEAVVVDALLAELRSKASVRRGRLSVADLDVNAKLRAACSSDAHLKGVEAQVRRTKKGTRLVISLPTGANLDKATKALLKALGSSSPG